MKRIVFALALLAGGRAWGLDFTPAPTFGFFSTGFSSTGTASIPPEETPTLVLVSSTSKRGVSGMAAVQSDAFDATGANLIVVLIAEYNHLSDLDTVTDTAGNTYTFAVTTNTANGDTSGIWYAKGATGANNLRVTVTASYSYFAILAYSGASADPLQSTHVRAADTNVTSLSPEAITPTDDKSAIVGVGASLGAGAWTLSSPFTLYAYGGFIGGTSMSGAFGGLLQETAAEVTPSFGEGTSATRSVAFAVFK